MSKEIEKSYKPKKVKEEKVEKEPLRRTMTIRRHGGAAMVTIPIEYMRELDWCPGTCVVVLTLHQKHLKIEKKKEKS